MSADFIDERLSFQVRGHLQGLFGGFHGKFVLTVGCVRGCQGVKEAGVWFVHRFGCALCQADGLRWLENGFFRASSQ